MVVFKHRAWKLITAYEKLVGTWPYQSKLQNYIQRFCLCFSIVSFSTTLMIRLVKEIDFDFLIVAENIKSILLTIAILLKLVIPFIYEKQRRKVYEQVAKHFHCIKDENEMIVLQKYSDKGLRLGFIYTATIATLCGIFYSLPIAKTFYYYLTGRSGLTKKLPLYVDYIVLNEQEHFYYILTHMFTFFVACAIIDFAFDLSFIIGIHHVFALFEIVKMRLKKASDMLSRVKKSERPMDSVNEVNKLLKSAIDMHNEVFDMTALFEKTYNCSWFVILIINTITLGISLLIHTLIAQDSFDLLRFLMTFNMFFIHFFVIFLQGQRVINSSSSVFDECYNFTWYNAPKCSCTLLLLIMNRSFKPCTITGGNGMFILSMETYAHMLKLGFSMYTVFKSLHE